MTEKTLTPQGQMAAFFAAFAVAQGAYLPARKNRTATQFNPDTQEHETWEYADLDELMSSVREALTKNGLVFYQLTEPVDGSNTMRLHSYIAHKDGGQISSCVPLSQPDSFADPKQYGAMQTLLRRYQAEAILGIAPYHETPEQLQGLIDRTAATTERPSTAQEPAKASSKTRDANAAAEASTFYSQERFDASIDSWREAVAKGVTTPEKIIAMIESVDVLTDGQRETILAIEVTKP